MLPLSQAPKYMIYLAGESNVAIDKVARRANRAEIYLRTEARHVCSQLAGKEPTK